MSRFRILLTIASGPHVLGFRFSHLYQQRSQQAKDSSHFAISTVQRVGLAVRTVLNMHMHRDAEDILSNRGRGYGCHGTYNVAWYKCTCPSPPREEAIDIFKAIFSDNGYVIPHLSQIHHNFCHLNSIHADALLSALPTHIANENFYFLVDFWHRGQQRALSASLLMIAYPMISFCWF